VSRAGSDTCAAIVVAAGRGERLGGEVPKALVEVGGRPLVVHAVVALRAAGIADVVVVHAPGAAAAFTAALADHGPVQLATGGASRSASVRAGLAALPPGTEVVAVHDAARGLQPPEVIAAAVAAVAGDVVAAAPSLPVTDTLKATVGERITGTVDRAALVAIQTPQVFVLETLRAVHASTAESTDDLALVEARVGDDPRRRLVHVPGSARGIKVTHPADVLVAEALLRSGGSPPR
jgi:2-C-methyl-D-erythritol 4-phosphate cytidylyltransferase